MSTSVSVNRVPLPANTDGNIPGTLVRRDASGNFSAGTITADLAGNANSATNATSANKVVDALSAGDFLTGGPFDGSAPVTLNVQATSANVPDNLVARDASGSFSAGIITATGIAVGQLTDATTVNAADELIIQQGGITKRATVDELMAGYVNIKHLGAKGDGVTDDTATIQAAIDAAYLRGGGTIYFPVGKYVVSSTIDVPQRVTLVGDTPAFVNQYVTNFVEPKGSVLFLAAGSNCDVVRFRCRLTNSGGVLIETGLGGRNADARHFGGMRGIVVWGNRSLTQTPNSIGLNTSGIGIVVEGSRYIRLEDVTVAYCADDGIKTDSYNYGLSAVSSNNLLWRNIASHSNAGNGFDLSGGDCYMTQLQAGFNAKNGIVGRFAASLFGTCAAWNNWENGFLFAAGLPFSGSTTVTGCVSYDNSSNGYLVETGQIQIVGCQARENGRTTNGAPVPTDINRSNFLVSSAAQGAVLNACYAISSGGFAHYGFYIDNTTFQVRVDNCYAQNHITADYSVANQSLALTHFSTTTLNSLKHMGFEAQGNINMASNAINNTRRFNYDGWQPVTSVSGNTLPVTTQSLIALDCNTPVTINAMTYTAGNGLPIVIIRNADPDTVTIEHNATGIRCANGANVVLGLHEAAMFVHVSGAIWQQVGGAY